MALAAYMYIMSFIRLQVHTVVGSIHVRYVVGSIQVPNGVGSIHVHNVVYSCRHILLLAVYTFDMSLVRYRYSIALAAYMNIMSFI